MTGPMSSNYVYTKRREEKRAFAFGAMAGAVCSIAAIVAIVILAAGIQ